MSVWSGIACAMALNSVDRLKLVAECTTLSFGGYRSLCDLRFPLQRCPFGCAVFAEGGEGLSEIAAGSAHHLGAVFHVEGVAQARRIDGLPHGFLGHPYRQRRIAGD